jgi:hypothetical protein
MLRTGDGRLEPGSARLGEAPQVHAVMQACGFTSRGIRRVIEAQMQQELDRGESAGQVGLRMIAAWKEFRANAHLLRYDWGASKFFGEGYWRNGDSWPWSEQALEKQRMQARAREGMA